MPETIREAKEQFLNEVDNFRKSIENKTDSQIKNAVEKFTDLNEEKFELFREENAKQAEELKELKEKNEKGIEAIEKLEGKMSNGKYLNDGKEPYELNKYFNDFLRKGDGSGQQKIKIGYIVDSPELMKKTLATDQQGTGGLAQLPAEMSSIIQEAAFQITPMRQYATTETISGDTWTQLKESGTWGEADVEERGTRSVTDNQTFGLITIMTHARYAIPKMTQKMVRQGIFNVEQWVRNKVARQFAKADGVDYCTGDGDTQPRGLLTVTGGEHGNVTNVNSGQAAALPTSLDKYIDVWKAIPSDPGYTDLAWYSNKSTFAETLKYKDGNDRYLLQNNIENAFPMSLMGDPWREMPAFPDVAANVYPIVYGDMRTAYTIVDTPGMIMVRDEVTSKGYILLYFEKWSGGGIVQPEAIVRMKISA